VISPLLANIYLHYVYDLWAKRWRRREAAGDMTMVRYADDIIVGFQHERDARRFWDAMRDRLREFSLTLHPDKTRLIEFGRYAAQNCERRGLGKPETFKFLGFLLICEKSRQGDFQIWRKSRRDRMRAKLREIKEELRRRRHWPVPEVGAWLAQVVAGYFANHAVPTNSRAIGAFRYHVVILWYRATSAQPESAAGMGADGGAGRSVSPQATGPASLAKRAVCRQTPKVGAVCVMWRWNLCGVGPGRGRQAAMERV
jgi:RNA-directed DNA polymerase